MEPDQQGEAVEIMHREFHLDADNERLAGTIIEPSSGKPSGSILSLHGAGDGRRQKTFYIAEHLAASGYVTTGFDMSGHGESTGVMKESTLKRRHDQALAVARQSAPVPPDIIMGSSMGGYIAATLLPDLRIRALMLICPALYAAEAYDVPFTESFTAILRRTGSYRDASALQYLRSFEGSVLLLIGENDKVIPAEVVELYLKSCPKARYVQHSIIPGAPHKINDWAMESPSNAAPILNEIDKFFAKAFG
jgi:alpha-beta hydrolase superfamily lysophospholipase